MTYSLEKEFKKLIAENASLKRVNKEWSDLLAPIDELVRPLTQLGGSVVEKAVELIKKQLKESPAGAVSDLETIADNFIEKMDAEDIHEWKYDDVKNAFIGGYDLAANKLSPRITEQYAREIAESYYDFCTSHVVAKDPDIRFKQWLENKNDAIGRALLEKLNKPENIVENKNEQI